MKKLLLLTLLNFCVLLTFGQNSILADEIMVKIKNGENISLENMTIIGDLDLTKFANKETKQKYNSGKEFKGKIDVALNFRNCVFQGDLLAFWVDGARTRIGNLDIKYNGDGDSYIVDFGKSVSFLSCVFEKNTEFKYSNFESDVNFEDSKFKNEANFKYARFEGLAGFGKADFKGLANFKYAKFNAEADFYTSFFNATADFKYANFDERVTFKKASFNSFGDFKYTRFQKEAIFQSARFAASKDFKYSNGKTYF